MFVEISEFLFNSMGAAAGLDAASPLGMGIIMYSWTRSERHGSRERLNCPVEGRRSQVLVVVRRALVLVVVRRAGW